MKVIPLGPEDLMELAGFSGGPEEIRIGDGWRLERRMTDVTNLYAPNGRHRGMDLPARMMRQPETAKTTTFLPALALARSLLVETDPELVKRRACWI